MMAVNVSGIYNGVKVRILSRYPLARCVYCASHNLNWVLNNSVENVTTMEPFLNCTYFFEHSIRRSKILFEMGNTKTAQKRLCPTHWSSRNDCLLAIKYKYVDIMKALSKN